MATEEPAGSGGEQSRPLWFPTAPGVPAPLPTMAGTLAQPRLGPRLGNADGARLGCRWSMSPHLTLKAWTLELELLGSNLG